MAEAAGRAAKLPAPGAHQDQGGQRHRQVGLDRHRGGVHYYFIFFFTKLDNFFLIIHALNLCKVIEVLTSL